MASRYALYRVTRLYRGVNSPTPAQVPAYLQARVAAGQALPRVEVVQFHELQQQKDEATGEEGDPSGDEGGRERVCAVLEYVLTALPDDLLVELLDSFHGEA
jgi:hypothetical protein